MAEGNPVSFTLTASPAPTEDLTVNVSWNETGSFLTATGPSAVTIPTSRTATLSADTDDDSTDESNGSVTVNVLSGSGYTVGSPSAANVTVTDDDDAVTPGVTHVVSMSSITPDPVIEGNSISVTLAISPPFMSQDDSDRLIALRFTDSSGLGLHSNSGLAEVGSATGTVTYLVVDDEPVTTDRTVVVSLIDFRNNYAIGSPSSMTVSVTDAP